MGQEKQCQFKIMQQEDIDSVLQVEKDALKGLWTKAIFQEEMANPLANYIVLSYDDEIVAYAGFWLIIGEAHVTNIGLKTKLHGRGLGKQLVQKLIDLAIEKKAEVIFLEVRKSNQVAQNLYKYFGFEVIGSRRGYYVDNNEDAILMKKDLL